MKRYEGLFILDTAGKEDTIKDTIDKISAEITSAGGKVETVQKMEKRAFARIADKKYTAGFYANVIFECEPRALQGIRSHFATHPDVFRVLFTDSPAVNTAVVA